MIKTARQLKALVQNRTKGDSGKAQLLIRNFMMERFLERVSLSQYKDNFILKGGMLVSSMVGLDNRATMDIDTTLKIFRLILKMHGKLSKILFLFLWKIMCVLISKVFPVLWRMQNMRVYGCLLKLSWKL